MRHNDFCCIRVVAFVSATNATLRWKPGNKFGNRSAGNWKPETALIKFWGSYKRTVPVGISKNSNDYEDSQDRTDVKSLNLEDRSQFNGLEFFNIGYDCESLKNLPVSFQGNLPPM